MKNQYQYLSLLVVFFVSVTANAGDLPDARNLQRDIERQLPQSVAPLPAAVIRFPGEDQLERNNTGTLTVSRFEIVGATVIPTQDIEALIQSYTQREITFNDITQISQMVRDFYRERGYLARVIVPQQAVRNGVVRLNIFESRLNTINVEGDQSLNADLIRQFLGNQQSADIPVQINTLRRSIAILNEQPGIQAVAVLQPDSNKDKALSLPSQQNVGLVKLYVRAESTPWHEGVIQVDNQGSKNFGLYRINYVGKINNPTGNFDQINPVISLTERTRYGRLGYNLPIGYTGLRGNIYVSSLQYHLAGDFQGYSGDNQGYGGGIKYPLIREPDVSMTLSFSLDHSNGVSDSPSGNYSHRRTDSGEILLSLVTTDFWHGRGENQFYLGLNRAQSTYLNDGELALDRATAKISGHNTQRINYTVSRLQSLNEESSLFINVSGQLTRDNLVDKFTASGSSGVRGFNGIAGDEGWFANLEYRHQWNDNLLTKFFVDSGAVLVNKHPWPGADSNRYHFQSYGIGLQYALMKNLVFRADIAKPLNPKEAVKKFDADNDKARFWLYLSYKF